MNSRLASRRLSSEKSSVLTKEALQDLNLQDFDVMEGWEPTPGKIYTKVRAISARINQNYDAWPSDELKKSYRTFLGKPVFVNHVNDDPRKARGVVVAARFVENGDDKYVEVIQEVDADRFPMLAHELVTGGLDSVSMGAEARICKCSYCGNEANDMLTMCSHVLGQKGQILGKVNEDGTREDILVYEECRDISFFELSYVFDPADETAVVSNVLTANKKRGYGETALPPQVDTLRDEEEDLGSYFIEPPEEFQEPDLDKEYPDIDSEGPSSDRRVEEQREDYDMARVSRNNRRRNSRRRYAEEYGRNLSRRRHAREYTPEDWEALEWDKQYVPFAVGEEMQGDDFAFAPPGTAIAAEAEDGSGETYEIVKGRDGGWYNNDYKVDLHWEEVGSGVVSRSPKTSNRRSRRGNNMSRNNRMSRRRYAEEYGRNDQGEQEEVYISQTPPAEPLETGAGASDAPNNSQGDRVKTDRNRSTHTNFEARRRRSNRRHALDKNFYEEFLNYAEGQGIDFNEVENQNEDELYRFDEAMYDFLDVNSVDDDDRIYDLMDASSSFGAYSPGGNDHLHGPFEDVPVTPPSDEDYARSRAGYPKNSRRRRARRRAATRLIQSRTSNLRGPRKTADYNGWSNWETWNTVLWFGNDPGSYEIAKDARSPEEMRDIAPSIVGDDVDFNQVDWNEVFDAFAEDRVASLRRRRVANLRGPRRTANYNGWSNWETWNTALWYGNDPGAYDIAKSSRSPEELAENAPYVVGDDVDFDQVNWNEVYDAFEEDRTASRRRRSNRRRANGLRMIDDMQLLETYAGSMAEFEDGRGGVSEQDIAEIEEELDRRGIDPFDNDIYSNRRRRSNRRQMAAFDPNISDDDLLGGAQIADVLQNAYPDDLESKDKFQELIDEANNRGLDYEQWKNRRARRRMAEQSDDFDLNSRADIARNVEDEDLFEAPVETQPKDASRKRLRARRGPSRSRRTAANGWANWDTWHANMYLGDHDDIARDIAFADSGQQVADMFSELLEGTDVDPSNVDWDELHDVYSSDRDYYKNASRKRRSSRRRRRMADTNLDLAAPDGRVNVEAPVSGVTDEDAQASQFDKGDYGHNAGDGLADPDLSTDQNWAPGEGKTSTRKASQIEGMRLAEAMVEAGLEKHDDRWKLAESYTKLPAAIVRDRISLLSRTASVKTPSRDDNGQRPMKSARKSPGLGNGPSLRKAADNKTDDYSLYF